MNGSIRFNFFFNPISIREIFGFFTGIWIWIGSDFRVPVPVPLSGSENYLRIPSNTPSKAEKYLDY